MCMCVCVLFYIKDLSILRPTPSDTKGPTCTVSPLHMNFQRCECSPLCQLLYSTTVLFKVLYCKMKKCLFFMYYLCGKYYKPITVQYYIADCVNWVSRLTLTHSSVLAWRIPGTGEPARLPSLGSHRVGHN
ncbi:unnamed protein product [Rangifer tarandus platyrhynchus]|uniref:Uncharacterized protein n=2 Tax=Rangifer tarandus platyrhynchus TaxID=3082113 RepID=A0ABN8Y1S6_RANTA|nr:unnamed protein product [Rangifer tarandus platyrhynchus]